MVIRKIQNFVGQVQGIYKTCQRLVRCLHGTAIVEFAILFPIFLLLISAAIEFGWYFITDETATRSVGIVSIAMQYNPSDPNLQTMANNSGSALIQYGQNGNYICAKSYASYSDAQNHLCNSNDWNTGTPAGVSSGTPYYIAVKANVAPSVFSLFGGFIYGLNRSAIVEAGASASSSNSGWVAVPASYSTSTPDQLCQSNGYNNALGSCMDSSSQRGVIMTRGSASSYAWYCAVYSSAPNNAVAGTGMFGNNSDGCSGYCTSSGEDMGQCGATCAAFTNPTHLQLTSPPTQIFCH